MIYAQTIRLIEILRTVVSRRHFATNRDGRRYVRLPD
jgi:hypothetical protein